MLNFIKKVLSIGSLLVCGVWVQHYLTSSAYSQSDEASLFEYKIKAAYLRNFLAFTKVSSTAESEGSNSLKVCIFAPPAIKESFHFIDGNKARQKVISVVVMDTAERSLESCQLLFVTKLTDIKLEPVLRLAQRSGILTVGETPGFCSKGGVIGFFPDGTRLGYQINEEAAKQSGITILPALKTSAHEYSAER